MPAVGTVLNFVLTVSTGTQHFLILMISIFAFRKYINELFSKEITSSYA